MKFASGGKESFATIAITFELAGLRKGKTGLAPTTAARPGAAPYRNHDSRYLFSIPLKRLRFGVISVASCAEGGPPFMLKSFCRKRLYRPTRISLNRAITYPIGLAMMMPSTVGVPPATSSITSLSLSPPAASQASAGVLSSDGVVPAVPPACTGGLSRIVSEPLYIVIRFPVVVERTSSIICPGHGRYSYCHPASGLGPSLFAVNAVLKMNCGIIGYHLSKVQDPVVL